MNEPSGRIARTAASQDAGAPRGRPWLLLAPALIFLAIFFVYPLLGMLARSLAGPHHGIGLANYGRLLAEPVWLQIIWITFQIGLMTTLCTLVLGYPLAYLLSALRPRTAGLLMILVIVPYFTSILVRTYAWMVLLGTDGILNRLLVRLGAVDAPIPLMYNRFAVLLGMTYVLLPYMVLALYSVMRGIDSSLLRAAHSLGASRLSAFTRIFLPLSMPGVAAGGLIVFILSLGFFITPALMGGDRDAMISMIIQQQVETYFDWPFASTLATVLLALTLVAFFVYERVVGMEHLFRAKQR
ncbi:ABC transporter permease [Bordetella genomosp. 11]|uniref:ABC transporter permease n=2 Tax=Bordetella genomosp. 11 TaxID=1416808 RepID=A0A261UR28_9BORD|nr:ABC transporter permease [Bordetella genomosp. 11]